MSSLQNFCKAARYIVFEILEEIPKIYIENIDINKVTYEMFSSCKLLYSPEVLAFKKAVTTPVLSHYFRSSTDEYTYKMIQVAKLDKDLYYPKIKRCYLESDSDAVVSSALECLNQIQLYIIEYLILDLSDIIIKYLNQQELTDAEILARKNPKRLKLYDDTEVLIYYAFEARELIIQEILKHSDKFDSDDLPSVVNILGPNFRNRIKFSSSWLNYVTEQRLETDYEYVGSIVTGNKDWESTFKFN